MLSSTTKKYEHKGWGKIVYRPTRWYICIWQQHGRRI